MPDDRATRPSHDGLSNQSGLSRRRLLAGAAAGLGAAGVGAAGGYALGAASVALPIEPTTTPNPVAFGDVAGIGSAVVSFFGDHQAGIELEPQAHSSFLAFTLTPAADRAGIRRMLRLITDDAARLTAGRPALADTEPELAVAPARLTVTVGFGPALVDRVDSSARPAWLAPLESFAIDRLEERWSGGDLLLEVASDDALAIAHASRMLVKDIRRYATLRWRQDGFRQAAGALTPGATQRNLFGQLDGTANSFLNSDEFARVVWGTRTGPEWLVGGTSYVLRRIAMNLNTWDELARDGREQAIGRRLDSGAPLTGTLEQDAPDFGALTALGLPVISPIAHIARARVADPTQRIFRRGYNYEFTSSTTVDAGLIFGAFQADPVAQFLPIQRRLAEVDLMNIWTTPIGSAVFAIPPGCAEGGFVGETLF